MPNLSLNDIVQVIVNISPKATARAGFNLGLIVGKSTVISAADRVKTYSSLNEMIAAGFTNVMPEYKAASLYFSQSKKPTKVAIGRWDETGTETALEAITACRTKNAEWYACTICEAVKADILSVAAYIETATPSSAYFYTTSDADVKAGTAGNVMETLQGLNYRRTIGQYSTTADAIAAIMGYAMGANTGTANSAYTLAYKQEVGVLTENLTSDEVETIKDYNGNVYISRGSNSNVFEQGVMADGTPFDEVINLDVLANDIQIGIMDLLVSVPKVPQTEEGISLIYNALTGPLVAALNRGFLAPGVWNGPAILNLQTGDNLSVGFLIQSETIASQPQADRDARKSPPVYIAVKLAGAIEHVVIQVDVNR
jgi:hypothetical protein